ncbi:FAD-dependent monooxygenase [Phytohabitans rumicis]|uniref:Monooxygenase n=1 Tax=Phytohabitans rumicis TaxID=1076125 RepID=A0A6V8KVZ9_9ACTN|nr:FAD-dependent monooxygenase [Phytohabitans rumicis]GFJ86571.1 monooxygenase [Phytohabitans rumicis]
MPAKTFSTPVLVVGAGAVGALLALELARHQVPSVVIERSVAPAAYPKMDCYLSGRSMELLRRLGLAGAIREGGVDPEHSTDLLWAQDLGQPPVLVWHHPSVNQMRQRYAAVNDGSAPAEPYQRVPGSLLEALTRDAARRHPLIDVREGWTFADLASEAGGVAATVVDPGTGTRHVIEARYLAACDGAGSTVRRCLEIPFDEWSTPTEHLSVHFKSADPVLRRHGRAFITIVARGLTLVSHDERDTWIGIVRAPVDEPLTTDPMGLVQERLGVDLAVDEVLGATRWVGSLAIARTYGKGSAYLVGDAAHRFYPVGGHAVNTGIADAVDLGWKLAALVSGWGGARLLDSYEAERRPVALFNRELCAGLVEVWRRFERLAAAGVSREHLAGILEQDVHQIDNLGVHFGQRYADSPVIWHERGDAPSWHWERITPTTWPGTRAPAVRLRGGGELFDRLGAAFTLVDLSGRGMGAPLVREANGRGIPMTNLVVDDLAVRACWERDLVLVRPDQHVAWRDDSPPADWGTVLDRVTGQEPTRTRHVPALLAGQTRA